MYEKSMQYEAYFPLLHPWMILIDSIFPWSIQFMQLTCSPITADTAAGSDILQQNNCSIQYHHIFKSCLLPIIFRPLPTIQIRSIQYIQW